MSTAVQNHHPGYLAIALLLAVAAHTFLILAVSFEVELPEPPPQETRLEITLVQNPRPTQTPEQADYLAQVSQEGGGNREEKVLPTTRPEPQVLPPAPRETMAPPVQNPEPVPQVPRQRLITRDQAPQPVPKAAPAPAKSTSPPSLTMTELLAAKRSEIARLSAELDRKSSAYAKRSRRKAISASTQEYKYANYLDAWTRKVERIGNLNYPEEARRRSLFGDLVLHVAVRHDGHVERIRLLRSSGQRVLDDAAVRIVRLAAPYAPFSAEIRKETDILDITRTWRFLAGSQLVSGD